MECEKVINSLRTLRDKGECISQTIVLDEAIKLLQASATIEEFNRVMHNCKHYEVMDNKKALLNEIGALRGLAYALESLGRADVLHDGNWFTKDFEHFIKLQEDLKK